MPWGSFARSGLLYGNCVNRIEKRLTTVPGGSAVIYLHKIYETLPSIAVTEWHVLYTFSLLGWENQLCFFYSILLNFHFTLMFFVLLVNFKTFFFPPTDPYYSLHSNIFFPGKHSKYEYHGMGILQSSRSAGLYRSHYTWINTYDRLVNK